MHARKTDLRLEKGLGSGRNALEINGTIFAQTFDQVVEMSRFGRSCRDRQ